MIFITIMFSPLLLIAAGLVFLVFKWLRLLPNAVPGLINFALVACLTLGTFLLYGTIEMIIVTPDRLQREYLGRTYASPLDLRYIEHQPHLMDPGTEWHYALDDAAAASLRESKCRPLRGEAVCSLYSHHDQRVIASATLDHTNRLHISYALW
jgi:hypothetical protein